MPEISSVDQDYTLWVLLDQATTLILNARDNELSEYGTSAMQAAVMFVVKAVGDKTIPADISRWILRKPSSVNGLLGRMAKAGLITMTKDLPKKNLVRIKLTDKGQKAYKQSLKRASLSKIMSCLSQEERRQLASSLEKLRNRALKVLGSKQRIPFPLTSTTSRRKQQRYGRS